MRENSIIKERILQYLDFKRISKYEFYQKTGISNGILSQKNGISEENILKFLSAFCEISAEWLLTGNGSMLKDTDEFDSNNKSIQREKYYRTLPLIPIDAIAGVPAGDFQGVRFEDCDQYCIPDFESKGAEFLIRVNGSSMYPKYSNGDILACKKIEEILFIQWGKVYVIDSSQGSLVKRLFEDKDNKERLICVSDNKEHYPPFSIPISDIRSLSIVIGVIRLE